jgi:hypothetical protein
MYLLDPFEVGVGFLELQSAENPREHPEVRPDFPLHLYWESQAEGQGPYFSLPCEQVLYRLQVALFCL